MTSRVVPGQTTFSMRRIGWAVLGLAWAVAAAMALDPSPGLAQTAYPNRAVRVVVPFGAGGVGDLTMRIVADRLSEKFGQRFFVENQPGAGGIAAARATLAGGTDGYTLALITNGAAVSVPLFKSLPFDPVKDFAPISNLGLFDFLLAVNATAPYATLGDVLQAARAKPGELNVATIIVGSTQNLAAQLFKSTADVDFAIVTYRSTPDALVALLRNDVQMTIDSYAALKAQLADQKVRILATTGAARSLVLPDVPTAQEAGVNGYDVVSWNGLFAPAGTPPDIVATLNAALRDILAEPETKKRMLELGIEAKASTPEELHARLVADIAKWSQVIERAGIPKQ